MIEKKYNVSAAIMVSKMVNESKQVITAYNEDCKATRFSAILEETVFLDTL